MTPQTGYGAAQELHAERIAQGWQAVGRKIGFTNRNIWPQYSMTSPIWHPVYDRTLMRAVDGKATLSLAGSCQPLIEPEIAFCLKGAVPVNCTDPATILQSIAWYAPSFEIVCCHFADWKCTPAEYAADFSLHWRLVVGTPVPVNGASLTELARLLGECSVTLSQDGNVMDRGKGSNALDHPALALGFLADIVARQSAFDALAAGEIITTGTLTNALPVKAGQTWQSGYEGLPGVDGIFLQFTS
jgi:2-keto-4-pentenoate hydratase